MASRDNIGGNNPTIKDFVLQQAYQKAFQLSVEGLKQYEKQRAIIIAQKKEQLQKQYDKRKKQTEASARVQKSSMINGSKMKRMKVMHKDLMSIVEQSEQYLKQKIVNNRQQYTQLLQKLILQGLIKMLQPIVLVRCLKKDKQLVRSILPQIKTKFKNLIIKQGIDPAVGNVDLRIDQKFHLQQHGTNIKMEQKINKKDQNIKCFGGIILTSEDGLIVCKNTLDSRIDLAYQHMLPVIRQNLFN